MGEASPFVRQVTEGVERWGLALACDPATLWYLIEVER